MGDMTLERERMVDEQLVRRGISDPAVLDAMRRVPRELFVPPNLARHAYEDSPLPISLGQTISQPYIVALMVEALELHPDDRVLEIGTGSGYAAAVIAEIAKDAYTIERHSELAETARGRLADRANVHLRHGDGTLGWPEAAPFDAILVSAGGPDVPEPLRQQLAPGGRLVIPIGSTTRLQVLIRLRRLAGGRWEREELADVTFVPLIGEKGWRVRNGPPDSSPGRG